MSNAFTSPGRKFTMIAMVVAAVVLTAAPAVVHGVWSRRWRDSADMSTAARDRSTTFRASSAIGSSREKTKRCLKRRSRAAVRRLHQSALRQSKARPRGDRDADGRTVGPARSSPAGNLLRQPGQRTPAGTGQRRRCHARFARTTRFDCCVTKTRAPPRASSRSATAGRPTVRGTFPNIRV